MKQKDLKIDFRYLTGNIACLSVDSISGESVHNDINNEEAIIIFNSLVGEKENCRTVKTLLEENEELKKQLEEANRKLFFTKNELDMRQKSIDNKLTQQKEFIKYLEDEIKEEKDNLEKLCELCKIPKENNGAYKFAYSYIKKIEEILQKYKEIIGVSNDY